MWFNKEMAVHIDIKLLTKYIWFCTNFKSLILVCSMECKCNSGHPGDGGVNVNNLGYCESYCHEYSGNYYCGVSQGYQQGVYVDCRGCTKTGITLISTP